MERDLHHAGGRTDEAQRSARCIARDSAQVPDTEALRHDRSPLAGAALSVRWDKRKGRAPVRGYWRRGRRAGAADSPGLTRLLATAWPPEPEVGHIAPVVDDE